MAGDDKKPRRLHMGDMLRSSKPNPQLHDAMDEAAKPKPKPDYSHLSDMQREVHEYRDEHDCSLMHAASIIRERRREQERLDALAEIKAQLSAAESVEELKPILEAIIDKLWS